MHVLFVKEKLSARLANNNHRHRQRPTNVGPVDKIQGQMRFYNKCMCVCTCVYMCVCACVCVCVHVCARVIDIQRTKYCMYTYCGLENTKCTKEKSWRSEASLFQARPQTTNSWPFAYTICWYQKPMSEDVHTFRLSSLLPSNSLFLLLHVRALSCWVSMWKSWLWRLSVSVHVCVFFSSPKWYMGITHACTCNCTHTIPGLSEGGDFPKT